MKRGKNKKIRPDERERERVQESARERGMKV